MILNSAFILCLSMGLCTLEGHLVQRKQNSSIKVSKKGINTFIFLDSVKNIVKDFLFLHVSKL